MSDQFLQRAHLLAYLSDPWQVIRTPWSKAAEERGDEQKEEIKMEDTLCKS